jgi:hypothetical protein
LIEQSLQVDGVCHLGVVLGVSREAHVEGSRV